MRCLKSRPLQIYGQTKDKKPKIGKHGNKQNMAKQIEISQSTLIVTFNEL